MLTTSLSNVMYHHLVSNDYLEKMQTVQPDHDKHFKLLNNQLVQKMQAANGMER